MGNKVTVDNITNVTNSSGVPTINSNFDVVADEFDKVVYRNGSQAITGTVDMDSNRLINLPQAVYATEPLRKAEADTLLSQAEAMLNAAVLSENYHETIAAGVAATAVGDLFVSDEGGVFKVYKKTNTPPNYEEILVPASQTKVDALTTIVNDLSSTTGDPTDFTMFFGANTGNGTTTTEGSTAVGVGCMTVITSGNLNTAFGARALEDVTSGGVNSAFGTDALNSTTTDEIS